MVKIGVLADTHIPRRAKEVPRFVIEKLQGAALIIHAGDLTDMRVIDQLAKVAPVEAVAGNIDSEDVREKLPRQRLITVGGYSIGVVHGDGTSGTTIQRARRAFGDKGPDCIVFGHSHIPLIQYLDGVLMVNPGSPTDPRRQQMPSFAIITVGDKIDAEIIYFDRNSPVKMIYATAQN